MKTYLVARREELKKRQNKGFTLMEMLIVVAIIAVLIAIAIPVFTSQLEKSREATDLANVRSAYAELMTAAATSDGNAKYTGDGKTIKQSDGSYKIEVTPLQQAQDGWQTDLANVKVGGVATNDKDHWTGSPTAGENGKCTITYTPAGADGTGESLVFAWA